MRIHARTLVLIALLGQAGWAAPTESSFTHTGRLEHAGVSLTGTVDLVFSLWDDPGRGNPPTGGLQVGPLVCVDDVDVIDGLFTVELDFGADALRNERARWLQTAVGLARGGTTYQAILPAGPRQFLTSLPLLLPKSTPRPEGNAGGFQVFTGPFQSCVMGTMGTDCEFLTNTIVTVRKGQWVQLWAVFNPDDGTPQAIIDIDLEKLPRAGGPEMNGVFDTHLTFTRGTDTRLMTLGPDDPVVTNTYWDIFNVRARLGADDQIVLTMDHLVESVNELHTESEGVIVYVTADEYAAGAHEIKLTVGIANNGDFRANYMVTLTEGTPGIVPTRAKFATLDPILYQVTDVEFTVRKAVPFVGSEEVLVTLKSPTGRIYHSLIKTIQPPL